MAGRRSISMPTLPCLPTSEDDGRRVHFVSCCWPHDTSRASHHSQIWQAHPEDQAERSGGSAVGTTAHAPQPFWVDKAASSLGVAEAQGVKPALPQEGAQLMQI